MGKAVCPGSFDPVTLGHVDIFGRAAGLFDELVIAIGTNPSKSRLFTPDERIEMLEEATAHLPNVSVAGFTGLLVDFCRKRDITAIVKGLRNASDFDFELPMAHMNARLSGVETVFIPSSPELSFVSSSLVKEVATFGGDVMPFLSPVVLERLRARLDA